MRPDRLWHAGASRQYGRDICRRSPATSKPSLCCDVWSQTTTSVDTGTTISHVRDRVVLHVWSVYQLGDRSLLQQQTYRTILNSKSMMHTSASSC